MSYEERIEKLENELYESDFTFHVSRSLRGSFVFKGTNYDRSEFRLLRAHNERFDPGQPIIDALAEIEFDEWLLWLLIQQNNKHLTEL